MPKFSKNLKKKFKTADTIIQVVLPAQLSDDTFWAAQVKYEFSTFDPTEEMCVAFAENVFARERRKSLVPDAYELVPAGDGRSATIIHVYDSEDV